MAKIEMSTENNLKGHGGLVSSYGSNKKREFSGGTCGRGVKLAGKGVSPVFSTGERGRPSITAQGLETWTGREKRKKDLRG